jgi:hypothetical protein
MEKINMTAETIENFSCNKNAKTIEQNSTNGINLIDHAHANRKIRLKKSSHCIKKALKSSASLIWANNYPS